jgi:hypothetical protein
MQDMHNTKRILLGMAALAIPVATMASVGSPAFAKPPPNPVSCGFGATVNIAPPLSVAGTLSVKGASGSATVHATYSGCHTATASVGPFTQTITIHFPASKPSKDQAAMNAGDNKKDYYLGLCGTFASSTTVKDLKKAVKNLGFQGGELKGPKASEGSVGADVGFVITGTVKGGTYPTASKAASLKAGLTNDANNSNLISGCQAGPVDHIDIDSSASSAVL